MPVNHGGLFLFANTMSREIKSLPFFHLKAASEGRIRKGICAVFGNVDSWGDRIIPGAFRKTISEGRQRQKHLWNHDFSTPPTAKIIELKEVSREELPPEVLEYAPEAAGGLLVAREYYKNNELSNWVLEAIDAGDVDEMSFGFDVIDSSTSDEEDGRKVRNLTEMRLFDTSDVLWGMNAATVGTGLKSAFMPLGVITQQFLAIADEIKSGRRNASNDEALIDAIHQASVELGSTKCLGIKETDDVENDEAEAAVKSGTSLDLLKLKVRRLNIAALQL